MNNLTTAKLLSLALTSLLLVGVGGCEQDGPLERAGESIDNAADNAGDAIEDAADDAEDAID